MSKLYRIGELSRESAVNLPTIRYYERIRLLQKPARDASDYRCYQADAVRRLSFIRRGRELGFSIDELRTCWNWPTIPTALAPRQTNWPARTYCKCGAYRRPAANAQAAAKLGGLRIR
jgi:DNA-binding transcriptional MerR regulator